ncbi:MAG: L-threonylcarbamoyladenylate synthase [Pirellulales bacterium]
MSDASEVIAPGTAASDEAVMVKAAALLHAGRLVAFPTETVYGLGADAANPTAVARIFQAKGRPADHPLIVHLADAQQLDDWARDIPDYARRLAAAFWPGPLTLILPRQPHVSDVVTGGLDTVGLRVPSHPVAHALLVAFGGGIAAPSANRFGRVSPTRAQHVLDELRGAVEMILDGGPCSVGVESTIVDATGPAPVVLRPGGVTREAIERVLGIACGEPTEASPRAPGRLKSHYAPEATVELVPRGGLAKHAAVELAAGRRVAVLAPSAADLPVDERLLFIRLPADVEAQARELYLALREVDRARCDVALVELPDEKGLGTAVADRLRKAAAP